MNAATVAVDPRMKSRRISVMRSHGRRRRRVLLASLLLVALVVGAYALSRTSLLDVDQIVVDGVPTQTARTEVVKTAGLRTGVPMITLDTGKAAQDITALAWVDSAKVSRSWPGTLQIEVTPRVPVAAVDGGDGTLALVDSYGYVISRQLESNTASPENASPGIASPENAAASDIASLNFASPDNAASTASSSAALVEFSDRVVQARFLTQSSPRMVFSTDANDLPHIAVGFHGELGEVHTAAGPALALVAALTDDIRPWVQHVTTENSNKVGVDLVGGATVTFGEPALLDDKVNALRSVLANTQLDCIVNINVTMADLTTVTRHPVCR